MDEVQQIEKEYGPWFNKFKITNQIIELKTIESEEFKLEFTSNGWLINDEEIFETFESAMMNKSDSFKLKFHEKLITKLNTL